YPSDNTIAGKVGKSPGHVQRCLRQLEAAGYIRREHTAEVRSGRRIWLLWRCPDDQGARPSPAPARDRGPAQARSEQVVVEQEEVEQEVRQAHQRQRPEPPVAALVHPMAAVLGHVMDTTKGSTVAAPNTDPTPPDVPPPALPPVSLSQSREAPSQS